MSSERFLFAGLMSAGLAVLGGYGLSQSAVFAQDAEDGPGPNLVIEVSGQAQGEVVIDLLPEVAPQHVERMVTLAKEGAYDGVVFHRVIEGFMAQTGDVEFGKGDSLRRAGTGGSSYPDLPAEFSDVPFARGVVGMARSANPNSANSQFFIMFAPGDFLNGQYTVVGRVVQGMDVVDAITRGEPPRTPDVMTKVSVAE
ncbi:peptidylprolyl isomerase [Cereibacter azotoformans]|uniref:Peptidyl-prolyl cis-trans isomerase n=1 Tax=Cereibacter azotoformans TaxID=43057 RepID=A0A2T5K9C7_9RHOB|nr:peptidylprolyl isomerase [Cereibacter azotoformans]AXQ93251.1 peptidylprolyl isomerase [Cereibacter sphaeroides]MBO4169090.1 peptidylprolyl isomerase [Cereibacter azotoformans]PTR19025.1 peptidylprolyl isomerase [Cereibacter azotoformans]UIJ31565.1 peptidylprolyl isomerase [Cereibacter azotoformans]ULB09350.1 peptidylprolyl isomerase [Cereibacter azotoformans]